VDTLVIPEERWHGGYYELHVALGSRSDERLIAALEALWAHPALEGPYIQDAPTAHGVRARRATWDEVRAEHADGLAACYGTATLHDGACVGCLSLGLIGHDGSSDDASDTLLFSLPGNGLNAVWPQFGAFPFVEPDGVRSWQEPLEEWLAELARNVFAHVPFAFACIGFEVMSVDPEGWMRSPRTPPPDKRDIGVLRREQEELAWYPTTAWGGPVGTTWDGLVDVTSLWRRLLSRGRRRLGRG